MPLLAKPIWLAARFWLSCIPCLKIAVFRNFSAHMALDISKYEPWIQNKRFFRNLCWGFCNIEKGECKRFYYFNYFSSPKSPSPCYDLKFEPKVNTRYNIWDQIFDPNIWCLSIFSMHFFSFLCLYRNNQIGNGSESSTIFFKKKWCIFIFEMLLASF